MFMYMHVLLLLQGRQGDKGQKGDGGVSSGIDVFSTVKVKKRSIFYCWPNIPRLRLSTFSS